MLFRTVSAWSVLAVFIVSSAFAQVVPGDAAEMVLQQIEKNLSGIETLEASFTQEKRIALFKNVMKLDGRIALDNQGRFAWHVSSPLKYSLIVADGQIIQWDEDSGKTQKTSLAGNPVLQVVFEQMSQWFSGQYQSLMDRYDVTVRQRTPPIVEFEPRASSPEAKMIRRVTIHFTSDGTYLSQIDVDETSGDKTRLFFADIVINQPIEPDAWQPGG